MSNLEDIPPDLGVDEAPAASAMPHPTHPTHPAQPAAVHRRERNRRVGLAILTALFTKPLALLSPLVTVPLYLKYLGPERFGLFQAIVSLCALLTLTNAGINQGLINRLMDARVANDDALARRYISSLMIVLAVGMAVAILVWTAVVFTVNWTAVFSVTDPRAVRETPWVVWLTGTCTFLALFLAAPQAILIAHQEYAKLNLWDGVTKILSLCACIMVVYTAWGLIGVALAVAGVGVITGLAVGVMIFARWPTLTPSWKFFDWSAVRATFGDGVYLFVVQASVLLLFQCDKLIIGSVIGAKKVTPFALVGQVFVTGYGLFMFLLAPMWPAYGDAIRRHDWAWARRTMRLSLFTGCGLVLFFGAAFLPVADAVISRWSRGEVLHVSHSLVLAMTATFLLRAWVDCRSVALNAAGVLAPQAVLIGSHATLNVVVALVLGHRFGIEGVAWATPITAIFTTGWGYPWMVRRFLWPRAQTGTAVPTGA